ncbi:MAG TPA: 4Fe-4S dicluster domain-containing protein [Noviherbaspirillum sp.]
MSEQRHQQIDGGNKTTQRFFRRLREGAPVEYCIEACQPVHSRYSDCRQCEQSCPVHAIHFSEAGVEVDASCSGCGQCAVACPTGALGVPGFAVPHLRPVTTEPVYIDCWQVPVAHSAKDTMRVPCLGGISLGRLVELKIAAGNRRIVLLDRGWCTSCATGMDEVHPAARCMEAARDLLQQMRVPSSQCPSIESRPLPLSLRSPAKPGHRDEQRLSRRAFFSDLAASITNTASEINPLTSGKQPPVLGGRNRAPMPSRERDRLLVQLRSLGEVTGAPLPPSLFPALDIDKERCRHHQLCAATCPTGALTAFNASDVSGMVFDSSGCIACGHCEAICPDRALRLLPHGDGQVPARPKVIARVRQRACTGCGRTFEESAADTQCPSCSKRTELAGAAFHALFGRPN